VPEELAPTVLADRLEHPVSHAGGMRFEGQDGSIDQLAGRRGDVRDPGARADRLCRAQVEGAGKRRQAAPQETLGLAAVVVAPVERSAQRLLARGDRAASAGEQSEAITDPLQHLRRGQQSRVGGGELDREWHPVEATAQLDDGSDVLRGQLESVQRMGSAIGEERHGR
jgi:hypothetical protein